MGLTSLCTNDLKEALKKFKLLKNKDKSLHNTMYDRGEPPTCKTCFLSERFFSERKEIEDYYNFLIDEGIKDCGMSCIVLFFYKYRDTKTVKRYIKKLKNIYNIKGRVPYFTFCSKSLPKTYYHFYKKFSEDLNNELNKFRLEF